MTKLGQFCFFLDLRFGEPNITIPVKDTEESTFLVLMELTFYGTSGDGGDDGGGGGDGGDGGSDGAYLFRHPW